MALGWWLLTRLMLEWMALVLGHLLVPQPGPFISLGFWHTSPHLHVLSFLLCDVRMKTTPSSRAAARI